MTHPLRGSAAFVVVLLTISSRVDSGSESFLKTWQSETHLEFFDGEKVTLHCPHDSWEINGTVYSSKQSRNGRNGNLPADYMIENIGRGFQSTLQFTASKKIDGMTIDCGNHNSGSPSRPTEPTVVKVVACVARLFQPKALDPHSLSVEWNCMCANMLRLSGLVLEFNSSEEYRRLLLDPQRTSKIVMGLPPQTLFDIQLILETSDGLEYHSKSRQVPTRNKGTPSMPNLFRIRPVKRRRDQAHSRYEFGIDLSVASCDIENVRKYVCEVSMWRNFTTILSNFTVPNVTRAGKWWDDSGHMLTENNTYYVRVKAVGNDGESLYSAASSVELTAEETEEVTTPASSTDKNGSSSASPVNNDNLLFSTIILAVLFVISGVVALYLILFLRYRRHRERSLERNELELKKIDLGKFDAVKKAEAEEKKSKKKRRRVSDVEEAPKVNGVERKENKTMVDDE